MKMLVRHVSFYLLLPMLAIGFYPSTVPEYCSKDMSGRAIPSLKAQQETRVSKLLQVQVVTRHGARTPAHKHQCWLDYSIEWNNCNVTELTLPSSSYTAQSLPTQWLYRKLYDGSPNELGGNCQTGQLLYEGYSQHLTNGQYLYDAYIKNSKLFDTDDITAINVTDNVYLRSDDEERTLLSGQTLVIGMFNTTAPIILEWHTGDYDLDQLYSNDDVCPYLSTLEDDIYATPQFVAENSSAAVMSMQASLDDVLGAGEWTWDHIHDCLLSTVCSDRNIPDNITGNGMSMTDELFDATLNQTTFVKAYKYLYNDSEWSRLAQGNTAWHISQNLQQAINSTVDPASAFYKFVLYSAHDTTVMPLLAAILGRSWNKYWSPYAAMMVFEVYSSSEDGNGTMFRMVYDGVPTLIPGCDDTLCSTDALLEVLSFGQQDMPCPSTASSNTIADDDSTSHGHGCDDDKDNDDDDLSLGGWVAIAVAVFIIGVMFGSAGAYFFINRTISKDISSAPAVEGQSHNPLQSQQREANESSTA